MTRIQTLRVLSFLFAIITCISLYAQEAPPLDFKKDLEKIRQAAHDNPQAYRLLDKSIYSSSSEKVPTYYWPVGHSIKIGFLNGDTSERKFITETAQEWLEFANLKFIYGDDIQQSEVRIIVDTARKSSDSDWSSFSELGITALLSPKSKPTMRLTVPSSDSIDKRRWTVLHEFGRMLGLPMENQNPNASIDWDLLEKEMKKTTDPTFGKYILANRMDMIKQGAVYAGKPFDPQSIMMHPLPPGVVTGVKNWERPTRLSSGDKQFVRSIYPKDSPAFIEVQTVIDQLSANGKFSSTALQDSVNMVRETKQQMALADALTPLDETPPSVTNRAAKVEVQQIQAIQTNLTRSFAEESKLGKSVYAPQVVNALAKIDKFKKDVIRSKGLFVWDQRYSPRVYQQIAETAGSVGYLVSSEQHAADLQLIDKLEFPREARLADDGELAKSKPFGTCFLIGPNLVLTCQHCLKRKSKGDPDFVANELLIGFDDSYDPRKETYPVSKIVYRGKAGSIKGNQFNPLDFALLELGPGRLGGKLPSLEGRKSLALARDFDYYRYTAVYVIGFPKSQDKIVSDNASIITGFEIPYDDRQLFEIEAQLEAANGILEPANALQQVIKNGQMNNLAEFVNDINNRKKQMDEMLTNFSDSFKRSDTGPFYVISKLLDNPPQPAFFLDSDTRHGSSGSPVFARNSSEVVGMLHRGPPSDQALGLKPGWLYHDEAIPIHLILQNWIDNDAIQAAHYGFGPELTDAPAELRASKTSDKVLVYVAHPEKGKIPLLAERRGDEAVTEGDIALGSLEDLTRKDASKGQFGAGETSFLGDPPVEAITTKISPLWRRAVIPYTLDKSFPGRKVVLEGIEEYNKRTKLRLVARTNEKDYMEFVTTENPAISGTSFLGRRGGRQTLMLNIDPARWNKGTVIHEIGHAWGLTHEHCRRDRDQYVHILRENIMEGYQQNFSISPTNHDVGSYDYDSIMHFPKNAYGKNGSTTIKTKSGQIIGLRTELSAGDILKLHEIYKKELAP